MSTHTERDSRQPPAASSLAAGNAALRAQQFDSALRLYVEAFLGNPDLAATLSANIFMAAKKYRATRRNNARQQVMVCGWELSHNAAGRAYALATAYAGFAQVALAGCLLPGYGGQLWPPLRGASLPIHAFPVHDPATLLQQIASFVAAHPADIVHLSKPRAPNILFGLLYKLIWGATVLVDIDDEELAFVGADAATDLTAWLARHGKLPLHGAWDGKPWTQLAVGMASAFDGITVSNPALQQRYQGELIRHTRDAATLQPSPELRQSSRKRFEIPADSQVVLFFGTPREHKGLLQIAQAIAALRRKDVIFAIVGDFPPEEQTLKQRLQAISGVQYRFIGNQPYQQIGAVAALGDYCILPYDVTVPAARFQVPAKLSDALAMGLTVLAEDQPALADLNNNPGLVVAPAGQLAAALAKLLGAPERAAQQASSARALFMQEFSTAAVTSRLQALCARAADRPLSAPAQRFFSALTSAVPHAAWASLLEVSVHAQHQIKLPLATPAPAPAPAVQVVAVPQPAVTPPAAPKPVAPKPVAPKPLTPSPASAPLAEASISYLAPATIDLSADPVPACMPMSLAAADVALHIVVYSDRPGQDLRLSLNAIAQARRPGTHFLHIVLDWEEHEHRYAYDAQMSGHIYRYHDRRGFYASVKSVIDTVGPSNICVIRQGAIIAPGMLDALVERCVIAGDYAAASPLTSQLAGGALAMQAGMTLLSTAQKLALVHGPQTHCATPMPDGRVFLLTRAALRAVPFPGFREDRTDMSLARYFAALGVAKLKLGVLLDQYALLLGDTPARTPAEQCALLQPDRRAAVEQQLLPFQSAMAERNASYQAATPVITAPTTVCILMSSLLLRGGVIVLVNWINQLIQWNVDVRVYVQHLKSKPDDGLHLLFQPKPMGSIADMAAELPTGTIVVGTFWTTAKPAQELADAIPKARGYYFIQDYEVLFYNDTPKEEHYRRGAAESYATTLKKVVTSDWIRGQLLSNGHARADELHNIPVGIDHAIFPPTARKQAGAGTLVLAMARPETPRRGYALLIAGLAAAKARNPALRVALYGSDALQQEAIPFDCQLLGVVLPENLRQLYHEADIFIDSSDFQGFGLAPLEAMAFGCACVLTDSGGISEYALDGQNALIVPHQADAIADAVCRLAAEPALRARLSAAAVDTAQRFDCARSARLWLEMFRQDAPAPQATRPDTAVIVPIYGQMQAARRCIVSALASLPPGHVLVLVDDCSDQHTARELAAYADKPSAGQQVVYLRNAQNLGFVGAANRGMAWAAEHGLDIILLNSDTIVVPNWIERLSTAAYSAPDVGVVSPLSTASSHLYLSLEPGTSFIAADRWLAANVQPRYPTVITPEGWCFYIKLEVYRRLGGFDRVFGRGYCEESDYCMRTAAIGYRLAVCENLMVFHQGKVTFGEERSVRYLENRKVFDRRWSATYQRLYRDFGRLDPLHALRARYRQENRPAGVTSGKNMPVVDLLRLLDDPATERDLARYEASLALRAANGLPAAPRIVFLIPDLRPYGGTLSVVMLANAWLLAGYDVKVVVLSGKAYDGNHLGLLTEPLFYPGYDALNAQLPEADLLIGTLWVTMYYAARLAASRPRLQLGYFVQDYEADFPDVVQRKLQAQVLRTYRWQTRAFAKTSWICDKVLAAGGHIVKVPPALETDVFYPRDRASAAAAGAGPVLMAMLRPGSAQRDPATMLRVFQALRQQLPGIRIWTFGCSDEQLPAETVGTVDKNFGVVDNTMLPEIYREVDVFLDTSLFHGYGRVIAEAMACGVACVITDSGGIADFASHEANCLIAPPGEAPMLTRHVAELLNDAAKRQRLAQAGRAAVEHLSVSESGRRTAAAILGKDFA